MKDLKFVVFLALLLGPFIIFRPLFDFYLDFNLEHGVLMSFIKFAILATLGEVIGLRIKTGNYLQKGFGIIPRAFVWGIIGITIKIAFDIFAAGTPVFLEKVGMEHASQIIGGELTFKKIVVAFSISTAINLFYAPVMMTAHKITDSHIFRTKGTLMGFFSRMDVQMLLQEIDWNTHWNFILKRTIPIFWIPAQTVTFLLPAEFRVLFAAFLGIVLGVLLAIASLKGR